MARSHPRRVAKKAKSDLRAADRATAFRQGQADNVLFVNSKTGSAGWLNLAKPEASTYFRPRNATRYLDNREVALWLRHQSPRRLDLATRISGFPSPNDCHRCFGIQQLNVSGTFVSWTLFTWSIQTQPTLGSHTH